MFWNAHQIDVIVQANKNGHFNFSKWYIMSDYPDWIKCYRRVMAFITSIEKAINII